MTTSTSNYYCFDPDSGGPGSAAEPEHPKKPLLWNSHILYLKRTFTFIKVEWKGSNSMKNLVSHGTHIKYIAWKRKMWNIPS